MWIVARAGAAGICALIGLGDSALAQPLLGGASVYYSFDSFVDEAPDTSGSAPPLHGDAYGNVSIDGDGVRGSSAFFDPAPQFIAEHLIAQSECSDEFGEGGSSTFKEQFRGPVTFPSCVSGAWWPSSPLCAC
jgi:hypothetical protein